jgi:hypothetical protein
MLPLYYTHESVLMLMRVTSTTNTWYVLSQSYRQLRTAIRAIQPSQQEMLLQVPMIQPLQTWLTTEYFTHTREREVSHVIVVHSGKRS